MFDIWIVIGFGVPEYLKTQHGFVPAGVRLGITLGPIAENGPRDSLIVCDGGPIGFLLTRPIALALLACIALALYFSFRPKPWQGEPGRSDD